MGFWFLFLFGCLFECCVRSLSVFSFCFVFLFVCVCAIFTGRKRGFWKADFWGDLCFGFKGEKVGFNYCFLLVLVKIQWIFVWGEEITTLSFTLFVVNWIKKNPQDANRK